MTDQEVTDEIAKNYYRFSTSELLQMWWWTLINSKKWETLKDAMERGKTARASYNTALLTNQPNS